MAEGTWERSLEETPTWAVAIVCLVFIAISLILEQSIHHAGKWLLARKKKLFYGKALDKIKSELIFLGFISLLLTVGQQPISKICISKKIAYSMLPCDKKKVSESKYAVDEIHRKLLWESMPSNQEIPCRRVLAASAGGLDHCSQKGMYPFVSQGGMHQLDIFIFILAILHVLYSLITMALGRAKMRHWKSWEKETQTKSSNANPATFRCARETSFVRRHMSCWSRNPILKWIVCFFRQFFFSVPKVDYTTLRNGFIVAHLAPNSKHDFHKYIKKSLDDDFKTVVGISPPLWVFAVVFLLLNVSGWNAYFWLSFVPLCIALLVGTKLEVIITEMALEIHERHTVVNGTPVVQLSDKRFWFNRPKLLLFLIHFVLFQNAFQLAFFLWIWYEFGLRSCFNSNFTFIMIRVAMGIGVQFLCSYITLPLYALVTQMGSHMSEAIFEEPIANAVKKWHKDAKKKTKKNRFEFSGSGDIESRDISHKYYASDDEMDSPSPHHSSSSHQAQPVSTCTTDMTVTPRQHSTAKKTNDITDFSNVVGSTEMVAS